MKIWRRRVGTRWVTSIFESVLIAGMLVAFTLSMGSMGGCPLGTGNGPPDGPPPVTGAGEIVSPASSFGMSLLDPPVSVIYNVSTDATNIRGYRVEVASSDPTSAAIGDKQVIASNLSAGDMQNFSFDPGEAGVGLFRVGILFEIGGAEDSAESTGVIEVQGPPSPIFIEPAQGVFVVNQGDPVQIRFDARDPENRVQWRLFYFDSTDDRTLPPDQLGTLITVGSGNAGTATLQTGGLALGDYQLGLSATDSGSSVAATAARGDLERIVTIPNGSVSTPTIRVVIPTSTHSPTIAITAPGATDVSLFSDEEFTIRFKGTVSGDDGPGSIEVFYDTDTNVGNGFTSIESDLPITTNSVQFPTGVPEGTYFVGATVRDDESSVTAYATGKIIVVRTITLEVTKPNSTLPVPPGSSVEVAWTTNAPAGSGTVSVVAQAVTATGAPVGSELPVLTSADIATRTASFKSTVPGLFKITVRLTLNDGTIIQGTAPAFVRFSSLPGVLWLGSLAQTSTGFGAILGGVNFEDNAGSSVTGVGDLDGDGLGELLVAARYGKPFFLNPSGVGPGEAYLIFGGGDNGKLLGTFHLNSVGTALLRGVTLTGIRTVGDSDETDGLATVATIPDADGDGLDDIVFGFPNTNSASSSARPLEVAGQFKRGGVVILSTQTGVLTEPTSSSPVIALAMVGQDFSDKSINATPAQTLADRQRFVPANGADPARCEVGSDQALDTVIGPLFGFIPELAPPRYETLNFEPSTGIGSPPNLCPTVYATNLGECRVPFGGGNPDDMGSGFHPAASLPRDPQGARILGINEGDGFGASVAFSNPLNVPSPGDIIISSPNQFSSGVGYLADNRDLWEVDPLFTAGQPPPKPHQYMIGTSSHCGDGRAPALGALRIVGDDGDQLTNILGIPDFNRDARNDILIGAPQAEGGNGRIYIAYRRAPAVEGDYLLTKLRLPPNDPERLNGLLVVTGTADALGSSLAGNFDFNGDGIPDIVVGSPDASSGTGEVIVIFGGTGVVSPEGGITLQNLLAARTPTGTPIAVRISGNTIDSEKGRFGFNIANAGDLDGDGTVDLLVAAPDASPRFDANPNDASDTLNTLGVDSNFDGVRDQVPGDDALLQAGLVYVILGNNRLDKIRICKDTTTSCSTNADCPTGKTCDVSSTINVNQLGTASLRGFIIAGRHAGDRVGGGDMGDSDIQRKQGKVSHGLSSAGDVDGDGRADIVIGAVLADPDRETSSDVGVQNGGEAYLIYGSAIP